MLPGMKVPIRSLCGYYSIFGDVRCTGSLDNRMRELIITALMVLGTPLPVKSLRLGGT